MTNARNTKLIGHIDCPGGGQVWVEGTTLYVGHMRNPSGTSIYDVSDPANAFFVNYIPPLHLDNAPEGQPALVTAYCVLALQETLK